MTQGLTVPAGLRRRGRSLHAGDRPLPPGGPAPGAYIRVRPKSSNSPFLTPPRKACHSSGVNRRTGPSRSRLLRTPTVPPGWSDTSTQLPLAKLSELLTQVDPVIVLLARLPAIGVPTFSFR